MRRHPIVASAATAILSVVTVWALWTVARGGRQDPSPLPSEVAQETKAFLAGPGAALVEFDQIAQGVLDVKDPGLKRSCETTARRLGERLGDAQLTDLAVQVPDAVLAQLFLNESSAVLNGLASCGQDDTVQAQREFLSAARSSDRARHRLTELG